MDDKTELGKTDFRSQLPRFSPESREANLAFVHVLERIAKEKNAASAPIALAWLLAQKLFIVPIPGTSRVTHLQENIAASLIELTPGDLREIDNALSGIKVHGGRMNEQQMQVVEQA